MIKDLNKMNYTNEQILGMRFSENIEKQASLIADEIIQEESFEKIASFYSDYGIARAESDIAKLVFSRFEKTASEEEIEKKEKEEEEEKEEDLKNSDQETVKEASTYADYILEGYCDRLANRGETDFNNPAHYFDLLSKHAGVNALVKAAPREFQLGAGAAQNLRRKNQFKDMYDNVKMQSGKVKQKAKNISNSLASKIESKIKDHYRNKQKTTPWSDTDQFIFRNRKPISKAIFYGGAGVGAAGLGGAAAVGLSNRKKTDNY